MEEEAELPAVGSQAELGNQAGAWEPGNQAKAELGNQAILLTHATAIETLPLYHKDPFDRMLVAQAFAESVTVVSHDSQLDPHGIVRLW